MVAELKPLKVLPIVGLLVYAGLLVLLTACETPQIPDNQAMDQVSLDSVFREFYENYGGQKVLGLVISPAISINGYKAQFLENALIYLDPDQQDGKWISFYPVGKELGISEKGISDPDNLREGWVFLNNHIIPPEFNNVFQRLGGQEVVGLPLTEVIYSPIYRRYEQYYENLGLYRMEDEPVENVNLLGYGTWYCADSCVGFLNKDSLVDINTSISYPYQAVVNQLGIDFTGYLLTNLIQESNGQTKHTAVFKNVVMAMDEEQGNVQFLQLPRMVGIKTGQPGPASLEADMIFIPVMNDLTGFDVPVEINDYILNLGGYDFTGKPINEVHRYGKFFRQCFEYLCLIFDPSSDFWLRIHPEALGYTYMRMYGNLDTDFLDGKIPINPQNRGSEQERELKFDVWSAASSISKDEAQIIYAKIHDKFFQPLSGLNVSLKLKIPEQGDMVYKLPPTDENGESHLQLPIFLAQNGTIIEYTVCVDISLKATCQEDSYVIWNNP